MSCACFVRFIPKCLVFVLVIVNSKYYILNFSFWDSPRAKTPLPASRAGGAGLTPGHGTEVLHAAWHV